MGLKAIVPLREEKTPEVVESLCCTKQPGLTVRVNGKWYMLVHHAANGQLATIAHRIDRCRGCWAVLSNQPMPVAEWRWGRDGQLDAHLRQIAREQMAEKPEGAK